MAKYDCELICDELPFDNSHCDDCDKCFGKLTSCPMCEHYDDCDEAHLSFYQCPCDSCPDNVNSAPNLPAFPTFLCLYSYSIKERI